jgi:hypothetical protein
MMHDLSQTYAQMGAFSPTNPIAGLNPLAANPFFSPQLGQQTFAGIPGYGGINPQQVQLAAALAAQTAISQLLGQSPYGNPLVGLQHNPLLALQGQQQHPAFSPFGGIGGYGLPHLQAGYAGTPYGQPYGQIPSPFSQFGQPLAPQTWVGQAGQFGQPYGQIHPLLQAQLAAARACQVPGASPWGL